MCDYDITKLESFLTKVGKYAIPLREPTLFAVGGRGHYENPASDLLAFFLKPEAEHGLGDLFLSTLLKCIKQDRHQLNTRNVCVDREVRTSARSFIDLEILGEDWCLIIENKIWHWIANPLDSYEAHAKSRRKKTTLLAILSPDGHGKGHWIGVSYKEYCRSLGERFTAILFDASFSKWHLFAREFILHMENELYIPIMKPEQATFLEEHAAEFMQAREMLKQYPNYLCTLLREEMTKRLGYAVEVVPNWSINIRSSEKWGKAWIAFRPPFLEPERTQKMFDISIFPDEGELQRGHASESQLNLLKGMKYSSKHLCWVTEIGFKDRDEAIKDILPRIKLIERQPQG